jgi:hypothetical protein
MVKKLKISHKQMIVSSILSLGMLFTVSYIGYTTARRQCSRSFAINDSIRETKKAQLQEFFKETIRDILTLSHSFLHFYFISSINRVYEQTNPALPTVFQISTPEYQQIKKIMCYHGCYLQCNATTTLPSFVLRMDM